MDGDIPVVYLLRTSAMPAGKVYSVWLFPTLGDPYVEVTGFTADSSWSLICANRSASFQRHVEWLYPHRRDAPPRAVRVFGHRIRSGRDGTAVLRSAKETIRQSLVADEHGRLDTLMALPAVKGKRGGEASVETKGVNCRVVLRYGWAERIFTPER
jgi:hypothetical protein